MLLPARGNDLYMLPASGYVFVLLLTLLFSSLSGVDIRYNATSMVPEWSVRGADTWNPFSNLESDLVGADAVYVSTVNARGTKTITTQQPFKKVLDIVLWQPSTINMYAVFLYDNGDSSRYWVDDSTSPNQWVEQSQTAQNQGLIKVSDTSFTINCYSYYNGTYHTTMIWY